MRKIMIMVIAIVGLSAGWYLLSPLWRVEERNDVFPGERVASPHIEDNFENMTSDERRAFDEAVEMMADHKKEMMDTMPVGPRIVSEGVFKPRAHEVAGAAKLIEHEGKRTLRFEDFETINGPDLHIYLSKDLSADDYIDLGKIRGTKGNINYEFDAGIDTAIYKNVMIWCVPFRVLFSYAELKEI